MKFSVLAEYFQKLESTSSRNSMVEILAGLFKEAGPDEIDKVAYLTQGRVAPLYEPVEFGMADRMILKALALSYGEPGENVNKAYKREGDLGNVAEILSQKSKVKSLKSVGEVYDRLCEITKTGGEGSVEKKIGLLAGLFKESDPLSAKYLARIPVDKLRLGFSDMTVLEGLSWMLDGTKKHKDQIEAAYNVRPDLGYIAKAVRQQSGRVREFRPLSVAPKVGTPILVMRAERLTSPEEILEKVGGTAAVEPKIDGLRTQLHLKRDGRTCEIRIFSRGLENVTPMYPDLVAVAEKEVRCDNVVLDGEAIGFDPKTGKYLPFQETVQRKRKYDIDLFSLNVPLKLVVFDCLIFNGESMIDQPYTQRRKIVEKLLSNNKIIVPAKMREVTEVSKLEEIFREAVAQNLEGIMAKRLDGVYQAGARGWNWIKYKKSYASKLADTIDAVVMGLDYGQGKRNKFGVGAFLVGVYDPKSDSFKTVSKIGTGLTDEEWKELAVKGKGLTVGEKPKNYDVNKIMACDVWLKPKLVGEFKADELTKSPMHTAGYALRFPRLTRWREKNPEDTTSVKEIEEMVKLQSGK